LSRLFGRKWDYDFEGRLTLIFASRTSRRTGKKTTLVERLKEYETAQSSSSGSRGISSSAIAFNSSSSSSTKTEDQTPVPEAPKIEIASGVKANVNTLSEIEIPDVEPALAPGLPEAKTDLQEAPPTLDIKMPDFDEHVVENVIPVGPTRICWGFYVTYEQQYSPIPTVLCSPLSRTTLRARPKTRSLPPPR
jgi:hypothetical protein